MNLVQLPARWPFRQIDAVKLRSDHRCELLDREGLIGSALFSHVADAGSTLRVEHGTFPDLIFDIANLSQYLPCHTAIGAVVAQLPATPSVLTAWPATNPQ